MQLTNSKIDSCNFCHRITKSFAVKRVALPLVLISLLSVAACSSAGYPPQEWNLSSCANPAQTRYSDSRAVAASAALRAAIEKDRGSGITAAVMIDGALVWSDAIGFANRSSDAVLTNNAKMRLGSVSKPLTAALVVRLVEDGRLDMDVPIQTYVPEFPVKSKPITIRQLLSHTSGIRHYNFSSFSESNSQVQYHNAQQPLAAFSEDPLLFEPGTSFHYSSFGYNLLGAAIENVSGYSFESALQRKISEPMNLSNTEIDNPERFTNCRPNFYTIVFGWLPIKTFWRNHSDAYPSAGIISTAEDLTSFATQVFDTGTFSPATRELLTAAVKLSNGEQLGRSLAWEMHQDENGDVEWYGHGGTTNGAYASLRYYPDTKMAVAGITNYNFWLTGSSPEFFTAIRQQIPEIFGQ